MKKKPDSTRNKKTAEMYTVPAWMDEDLKLQARWLDTLQRHELADKLERQAEQLRELKPPPVAWDARVELWLRPNMKRALLVFANHYGADEKRSEAERLALGIVWFLEGALPLIESVAANTDKQIYYRNAEGHQGSVLTEKLIGDALAKYETNQTSAED